MWFYDNSRRNYKICWLVAYINYLGHFHNDNVYRLRWIAEFEAEFGPFEMIVLAGGWSRAMQQSSIPTTSIKSVTNSTSCHYLDLFFLSTASNYLWCHSCEMFNALVWMEESCRLVLERRRNVESSIGLKFCHLLMLELSERNSPS